MSSSPPSVKPLALQTKSLVRSSASELLGGGDDKTFFFNVASLNYLSRATISRAEIAEAHDGIVMLGQGIGTPIRRAEHPQRVCGVGRKCMSALIAFICRNPKHQGHAENISNSITINDGEWAFCPTGAADQHVWERTPATTLYSLRHIAVREERVRA